MDNAQRDSLVAAIKGSVPRTNTTFSVDDYHYVLDALARDGYLKGDRVATPSSFAGSTPNQPAASDNERTLQVNREMESQQNRGKVAQVASENGRVTDRSATTDNRSSNVGSPKSGTAAPKAPKR